MSYQPLAPQAVALVTGAARRLGRAFALTLARQGYAILLHYHTAEREARAAAEEMRALGVPVHLAQADLTDADQVTALFASLDALSHPLKVLVNSAALIPRGNARDLSLADWDAAINLNLRAPFLCAQQAAMRMKDGGLIVNVSDVGAGKVWSRFPSYTVSKAALETLTRVLARALAPRVRVNAIAPGLVLPSCNVTAEEWEKLVARLPLRRPARLDEITSALEFLLANEYITGQTIIVDGGYSLL